MDQNSSFVDFLKENPSLVIVGLIAGVIGFFVLFGNRNSTTTAGAVGTPAGSSTSAFYNTNGLPVGPDGNPVEYIPTTGDTFVNYSTVNNTNSGNTTTNPAPAASTQTAYIRGRFSTPQVNKYDTANKQGIPIRATPDGSIIGYAPYGSAINVVGSAISGKSNLGAGTGSTQWLQLASGGLVSAYDITGATQQPAATTTIRTP